MGPNAFEKYVASILGKIASLNGSITVLERRVASHERKRAEAKEGSPEAQKTARNLEYTQLELTMTRANLDTPKAFYVDIFTRWSNPKDRIIGYVDWAPPIGLSVPPYGYTRDLCIIKLDKQKFKNFLGNVLSLGPEMSRDKFMDLMYDRIDVPSEFQYPEDGLLPLQGMLTADLINDPNSENLRRELTRRVIKRGFTTLTTVGTLSKFMSHVRMYTVLGYMDSIEVAILPHDNHSEPFSRGGDSGSLVVDAHRRFVALLTGGTGKSEFSDISFATLLWWIWILIE